MRKKKYASICIALLSLCYCNNIGQGCIFSVTVFCFQDKETPSFFGGMFWFIQLFSQLDIILTKIVIL